MIENEILRIFNLEDMEMDKPYCVELESGYSLRTNGIYYEENIVSKVEFSKHNFSESTKDNIFIYFFMGNVKLGCILTNIDCVLKKDSKFKFYTIDEAADNDYQKAK